MGIKPWPQGHKVLALTQHQYYPMTDTVYFTCYTLEFLNSYNIKTFQNSFSFTRFKRLPLNELVFQLNASNYTNVDFGDL